MGKRGVKKITKQAVDALKAGETLWDAELPGFGVRANAQSKTYILKAVLDGRQKWLTIGRHGAPWTPASAREEALQLVAQTKRGVDPSGPNVSDLTMEELCKKYMSQHAWPHKKASSAKLDEKNIANHLLPLLGKMNVRDVTPKHIDEAKLAIAAGKTAPADAKKAAGSQGGGITVRGGKGVANRCLTLLSKMFNLAELWELRPRNTNPVPSVQRYKEQGRERFLDRDEYARLGRTLENLERNGTESVFALAAIRLLMVTGARLGEIQRLRWENVHAASSTLRLPDSKTGKKVIRLSTSAMKILNSVPRVAGNPFVIAGGKEGQYLVDIQRPWQRIRAKAALPGVRIHDLRHSFASMAASGGVPLPTIAKLLGHTKIEVTNRYAHIAEAHAGLATNLVSDLIDAALASESKPGP